MKAKKIILSILDENAITAKTMISEELAIRVGQRLAEEYVRVAKETFNEGKKKDHDGDGDIDSDDWKAARDAAIKKKMKMNEAEEEEGEEEGEEEEGEEEGEEEAPINIQAPRQTRPGFDVRLSYGD
jgi:hypothetical protein